jgi:hypothetical protein
MVRLLGDTMLPGPSFKGFWLLLVTDSAKTWLDVSYPVGEVTPILKFTGREVLPDIVLLADRSRLG